MSMAVLELVCLAIVAAYVGARLARAPDAAARRAFVLRFAAIAVAAVAGEDSMIHAYGAYAYARSWSVFVDRVPLVVVLVWPVVIDSAAMLARRVVIADALGDHRAVVRTSVLTAADASLIEPIAVRSALWSWSDAGLFDVPLVGIAGWAMFAGAATAILEHGSGRGKASLALLFTIVLAPLATHGLVLASWWGLFRWVQGPVATTTAIAIAWVVLGATTLWAWRVGRRVPLADVLLRAPGAAFFFGLLALLGNEIHDRGLLLAYALAFAPPYLAAMASRLVTPGIRLGAARR